MKLNWGTMSMLSMHLKVFEDLIRMRETHNWNWDYIINLSESDYPLKYSITKKYIFN